MGTIAVLIHDGFYGCGTGAGVSNRRFLEVLVPLLQPGERLVVMPVWVAETSSEYDAGWHEAMRDLAGGAGARLITLDNGTDGQRRFGSVETWRRLAASAECRLRTMGLSPRTLVVAFDVPFLELPGRLGRSGAHIAFVPRGTLALHEFGAQDLAWERACYRAMAGAGVRVGLISAFMGRHLASACGVPEALMTPVFDGVTRSEWSDPTPAIPLPAAADSGFMLVMGRAHPYKGFDDLLDALEFLRNVAELPHVIMAAVTEDDVPSAYQRHLQRRVAEERLGVTVVTRFSSGVRALIGHGALRAVIVPSRVEPFGRVPMEVFSHPSASSVVVIAASTGGLEEVVANGRTGFSFSTGSAAALARAIVSALHASSDEARRLHAAGRRLLDERYSYEANVAAFLRAMAGSGLPADGQGDEAPGEDVASQP